MNANDIKTKWFPTNYVELKLVGSRKRPVLENPKTVPFLGGKVMIGAPYKILYPVDGEFVIEACNQDLAIWDTNLIKETFKLEFNMYYELYRRVS